MGFLFRTVTLSVRSDTNGNCCCLEQGIVQVAVCDWLEKTRCQNEFGSVQSFFPFASQSQRALPVSYKTK